MIHFSYQPLSGERKLVASAPQFVLVASDQQPPVLYEIQSWGWVEVGRYRSRGGTLTGTSGTPLWEPRFESDGECQLTATVGKGSKASGDEQTLKLHWEQDRAPNLYLGDDEDPWWVVLNNGHWQFGSQRSRELVLTAPVRPELVALVAAPRLRTSQLAQS